jgi:hypothetical protein
MVITFDRTNERSDGCGHDRKMTKEDRGRSWAQALAGPLRAGYANDICMVYHADHITSDMPDHISNPGKGNSTFLSPYKIKCQIDAFFVKFSRNLSSPSCCHVSCVGVLYVDCRKSIRDTSRCEDGVIKFPYIVPLVFLLRWLRQE